MELFSLTAILGIFVIFLIYWWTKKNLDYWKERGIPHRKALPLIGSVKDLILGKKSLMDFARDLYKEFDGEKYCGYHFFTNPVLLIRDIDLVNHILIKDFSYFVDRFYPADENLEIFNSNLSTITGEKWKVLRHKLTPTFSGAKMKQMFDKLKGCSDDAIAHLKKNKGEEIEMKDFLFKFVVNVIGDVGFGLNVNAFSENNQENEFLMSCMKIFLPSAKQQLIMLLSFFQPRINSIFGLKIMDKEVNDFFINLVKDIEKYRKQNNVKSNDLLQLMLDEKEKEDELLSSAQKNKVLSGEENLEHKEYIKNIDFDENSRVFTDNIIAAQAMIFISAGTETTASILSFALYELAFHKDIQKRAQEEVDSVLANEEFKYESLKKLPYLEAVLNEVLRFRTPAGAVMRVCTKDYKLPGTDMVMKKNTLVSIPVLGIHMDPQFYSEPEKFNPDRFMNMDDIPKGAFFPFGGGPRICIAMRLVMYQMKVFLAVLLRNFNISLNKKMKLPIQVGNFVAAQEIVGGLWLDFEERMK